MKTSTFFTLALTVAAVSADLVPAQPPTKVKRDLATVTSVVSQVSAAITKLDTSVKSFDGSDLTTLQTNAQALISALTSGASSLSSSSSISLSDALSLQSVVTPLGSAAETLVKDVVAKKDQFEQAAACSVVGNEISSAGTAAKTLVDGVVSQVPEAAQSIAQDVASKIVDTLTSLVSEFSSENCKNSGSSASSAATVSNTRAVVVQDSASSAVVASTTAKEVATNSVVTVTVTEACACSRTSTSSAVVHTSSTPAPVFPANSTTVFPTGTGARSTTASATQSIVTAGAVAHGATSGSMGFVAAIAAVLFI